MILHSMTLINVASKPMPKEKLSEEEIILFQKERSVLM